MDWPMLLASVGGSAAVTASLLWLGKTAIEKAVDSKLRRSESEQQARMKEMLRRQAFVWDKQFDASKTLLGLIYRVRNTARELLAAYPTSDRAEARADGHSPREILARLYDYRGSIEAILFDERATVPRAVFRLAHEVKHEVAALRNDVELFRHEDRHAEQDVRNAIERLDKIYAEMADAVERFINESVDSQPAGA